MVIEIEVAEKIARLKDRSLVGVCGNSDYVVRFAFDAEWDAYETKTARFKWSGTYTDVVFSGNECAMPIINNSYCVEIGVYAGNLHTTTTAILLMKKSVLCDGGTPAAPPDDVYAQIMHKLNNLAVEGYEELDNEMGDRADLATEDKSTLVAAINEAANSARIDNQTIIKGEDGKLKTAVGGYVDAMDEIVWDGNTEGLVSVEGVLYKLSSATPSAADLVGKPIEYTWVPNVYDCTISEVIALSASVLGVMGTTRERRFTTVMGAVAMVNGAVAEGLAFPEKGIYLVYMSNSSDGTQYVSKFPAVGRIVHEIDYKFLPMTSAISADSTHAQAATAKAVYDAIQDALTVNSEEEAT